MAAGHVIQPRELLVRLGEDYRHFKHEHDRQSAHSATRRRLASKLHDIAKHFERLLTEWVPHELRLHWREFLRGRELAPDLPVIAPPPLFKGTTDAGAVIEIRPAGEGYDILSDGARLDHSTVPWHLDPDRYGAVQIGQYSCTEIFEAPEAALRALGEFLAGRGSPPWQWARALLEDGVIDSELGLTARGRRCLQRTVRLPAPQLRNLCVLSADAVRGRVFVLDTQYVGGNQSITRLTEVADITNPMLRARDAAALSETRPGLRREAASTPRHAVSDHREDRRRDIERHFAARIAEEAAAVWRRYPWCELIVVASPVMLGLLRPAIERQIRAKDRVEIRELARDMTKLAGPKLHDVLTNAGLLPARGHVTPMQPPPGQPLAT